MNLTNVALLACLTVVTACGGDRPSAGDAGTDAGPPPDSGPPPPPERCAGFVAPGPGLSFRDVTADWGVDATGLDVLAERVTVADLDSDGFPDVVVHRVGTARADFTEEPRLWPYRVLMNRPNASGTGRHFEDRTRESSFGALLTPEPDVGRASHLVVFGDLDGDGDLDAISGAHGNADTDPGDRSQVLLNDGTGTFSLAAMSEAISGIGSPVPTSSVTLLDFDRDGRLDVFVGFWYARYGTSLWGVQDRLGRGRGDGTFEDVTDAQGLGTTAPPGQRAASRATYGVTACDVDGDGDTDLLTSAYGRQWNQLWLRGSSGFVDVGEASGYDGDDLVDYADNDMYRCYCQTTGACSAPPPRTRCDVGGWNPGLDDQPSRLNGNTFTTVCGDVDDDGDADIYNAEIRHFWAGMSSDGSELLLNGGPNGDGVPVFTRPGNGATGLEVPHVGSAWNEGGIGAAMADLDNDGLVDILLGTAAYPDQFLWVYRQGADRRFTEAGEASGVHHACGAGFAVADLDRDGDLDLLVGSSTANDCRLSWPDGPPLRVYENTNGQDANWVQARLVGSGAEDGGANRDGIGAIVRVTAGGVTRTREVQGGYGHFGMQHDMAVTIGLGQSCTIDALEVRWPDAAGSVQRFEDVRANYRLVIRQGVGLEYLAP